MDYYLILIHIISATVWTGGHLVLAIGFLPKAISLGAPQLLNDFESVYEKIGIPALFIQIITGVLLGYNYFSSFLDFFSFSTYHQFLLTLKFLLLGLTVVLALDARLRIIPKLGHQNLRALAWHIFPISIISVLYIVVGVSFKNEGFLYGVFALLQNN